MTTLSIQTKVSVDEFVEAADQLQDAELEKLTRRLLQLRAHRKTPSLSEREAYLLEAIAQSSAYEGQTRYHELNRELNSRELTENERSELHELVGISEAQSVKRLSYLVELSQLRGIALPALMKQFQIKDPGIV